VDSYAVEVGGNGASYFQAGGIAADRQGDAAPDGSGERASTFDLGAGQRVDVVAVEAGDPGGQVPVCDLVA
jgi:hypothetical protein